MNQDIKVIESFSPTTLELEVRHLISQGWSISTTGMYIKEVDEFGAHEPAFVAILVKPSGALIIHDKQEDLKYS